jgi:hypothetical protein
MASDLGIVRVCGLLPADRVLLGDWENHMLRGCSGRPSLVPAGHSTPTPLLLPWHAWTSDCSSLPSRFSPVDLSRRSPAFAHGPDRPPAFRGTVRLLPFDGPAEQLTPRQSRNDPGVLPDGPVLWSGRVLALFLWRPAALFPFIPSHEPLPFSTCI